MYWLRSQFEITSLDDLKLLIRIYDEVQGELHFLDSSGTKVIVEWTTCPFNKLLDLTLEYPLTIQSRLVGPQTVMAVSMKIKKIDPALFEHEQKELLMLWANYIDTTVSFEMNRTTDIGRRFQQPNYIPDVDSLIIAARLSKYATHVYIGDHGIVVSNKECCYLPWIGKGHTSGLMFDKDDGLLSPFGQIEGFNYITECFNKWKASGYSGDLSDYCTKYHEHMANN